MLKGSLGKGGDEMHARWWLQEAASDSPGPLSSVRLIWVQPRRGEGKPRHSVTSAPAPHLQTAAGRRGQPARAGSCLCRPGGQQGRQAERGVVPWPRPHQLLSFPIHLPKVTLTLAIAGLWGTL